jgi:NAD(P)-dependent dehydrogenase (short-subunit alcohol dehydrogenase family)
MKDLRDKVAVITGGASGMGRAMADRFAAEGMKLVLADVEPEALARAEAELRGTGATVASKRTDVSRAEDVEALAKFTIDTFGAVHVLCNNAGIGIGGAMAWQQSVHDWEWVLGVNLWGVIHGVRVFTPLMLAEGDECHIVNTASGAGLHARPGLTMYSVSKHAVVALSESLYGELRLAESKIGVSVLCPAVVNTRIGESERNRPEDLRNSGDLGDAGEKMKNMERAFRAILAATGMPPEDVAAAVVDAIRNDRFYIITHEETKARVRTRMEDILQARNPTPPS